MWSSAWKSSKQPRKQRKFNYNAPAHTRSNFLNAHLSKELRSSMKKRTARIRSGSVVKIMRGEFKGKTGKVEKVLGKLGKIIISGLHKTKVDGSKVNAKIRASNVLITEMDVKDKKKEVES